MIKFNYFLFTALIIWKCCFDIDYEDMSSFGDWQSYQEEKCYKIFTSIGLKSYEDADRTCLQQESNASIITINSLADQEFVSNLIKSSKLAKDVWIGIKLVNGNYKWVDNTDIRFNNWEQNASLKNQTDYCAQINTAESSFGKCSEVLCGKLNYVVCQKTPSLSLAMLHKLFLNQIKNPFPVGFIYVQLPSEKSPTEMWPSITWSDISDTYAGVFFRVTGGNADPFGSIQEENIPYTGIDEIGNWMNTEVYNPVSVNESGWSKYIWTGGDNGPGNRIVMRFHVIKNEGEMRPRNMAIRVWKRVV